MARIKTRKVRIIDTSAKFVTLLFLGQNCQVQISKSVFDFQRELGLYEILNPAV